MKIKDLKIGTTFKMEGLDTRGKKVQANAKLVSINKELNYFVVESQGIRIKMDGEELVSKVIEIKNPVLARMLS